jgi:arylsulfatase
MQTGPDSEHAYSRLTAEHHMEGWLAGEAVDALGKLKDSDKPFCMVVSFYGPHHPCAPPKPYDDMYALEDIELPESFDAPQDKKNDPPGNPWGLTNNVREKWTVEQCKDYIRRYLGGVTYIDDQMTRVLDALKANGLEDNTIIMFSCDHGEMMCEQGLIYKHVFNGYDTLMKVPLLVQWPGHIEAGKVHEGLTSHVDLMPTLLALAGADIPDQVDGKSMADVLTGDADVAREEIFCDVANHGYMTRKGQWKFVLNASVLKGEFIRKLDELYDLESDPNEITNLADEPEHAERVAVMKERVLTWLAESGHPYADKIREAAERGREEV